MTEITLTVLVICAVVVALLFRVWAEAFLAKTRRPALLLKKLLRKLLGF